MKVMKDPGKITPTGDAAHRHATPEELAQIERSMETGLEQGALGVGMGINYTGLFIPLAETTKGMTQLGFSASDLQRIAPDNVLELPPGLRAS